MGVRDIRAEGANVPEANVKTDGTTRSGEISQVDRIRQDFYEGERLKAFKQGAGYDQHQATQGTTVKSEEKTTIDVGAVFKAMADQNTALITKFAELQKVNPSDPLVAHLVKETEEMKSMMQNSDPMDFIDRYRNFWGGMVTDLKKELGLPEGMGLGTGRDVTAMLELKKVEMTHDTQFQQWKSDQELRNHHWEEEREERRRRYEVEDRRWNEEFAYKKKELEKSADTRDKVLGTFEDLATSFWESKVEGGAEAAGEASGLPGQTPAPQPGVVFRPKVFKCTYMVADAEGHQAVCNEMINVPPDSKEITCPKCGGVYDLVAMKG